MLNYIKPIFKAHSTFENQHQVNSLLTLANIAFIAIMVSLTIACVLVKIIG